MATNPRTLNTIFQHVSDTIQRYVGATDLNGSAQCMEYALYAQHLLAIEDISSEIRVGYSAWRVGPNDGDVIVHVPGPQFCQQMMLNPRALIHHAWLEVERDYENLFVDFSTQSLRRKAMDLDAMDGQTTTVEWVPDFLVFDPERARDYGSVRNGDAGQFFYQRDLALEKLVLSKVSSLDDDEEHTLELIHRNPFVEVLGPKTFSSMKP